MDINKALEKLEAVRPDSADLLDPEFKEAAALIEANADLEAGFHRRLNTDRQIGDVMQDVIVPTGLKERLLTAAETQSPTVPVNVKPKLSRRTWLTAAASAVAVVAVTAFLIQAPLLTLADLRNDLPLADSQISSLPLSDAGYEKISPSVGRLIQVPGHRWKSDAAVYSFPCNQRNCVLVVMPAGVADVGSLTHDGTVMFSKGYTMTGWTEGPVDSPLVCVLIVEGNAKDLEGVSRRLRGMTAA